MELDKQMDELSAQLRLAEILNDSPRTIKLGGREFKIKALRPGTQWLLAEEACKIAKNGESFTDLIKQFAMNAPSVAKCLCLAILNDKEKINGNEYSELMDFIQWETNPNEWIGVLVEVLQMIEIGFFLTSISVVDNFRQMMKKKTDIRSLSTQKRKSEKSPTT